MPVGVRTAKTHLHYGKVSTILGKSECITTQSVGVFSRGTHQISGLPNLSHDQQEALEI